MNYSQYNHTQYNHKLFTVHLYNKEYNIKYNYTSIHVVGCVLLLLQLSRSRSLSSCSLPAQECVAHSVVRPLALLCLFLLCLLKLITDTRLAKQSNRAECTHKNLFIYAVTGFTSSVCLVLPAYRFNRSVSK